MEFSQNTAKGYFRINLYGVVYGNFSYFGQKWQKNGGPAWFWSLPQFLKNFVFGRYDPKNFWKSKKFFAQIHYLSMPNWWLKYDFFLRPTIEGPGKIMSLSLKSPLLALRWTSGPGVLFWPQNLNFWGQAYCRDR